MYIVAVKRVKSASGAAAMRVLRRLNARLVEDPLRVVGGKFLRPLVHPAMAEFHMHLSPVRNRHDTSVDFRTAASIAILGVRRCRGHWSWALNASLEDERELSPRERRSAVLPAAILSGKPPLQLDKSLNSPAENDHVILRKSCRHGRSKAMGLRKSRIRRLRRRF